MMQIFVTLERKQEKRRKYVYRNRKRIFKEIQQG